MGREIQVIRRDQLAGGVASGGMVRLAAVCAELAGNIGVGDVCDFTCVGEPVNVAARLQALARPGEIVVGPTAWRQAADLVETEGILYETETAELKGIGTMTIRRLRPHLRALYASPSQYPTCPTAIPGRERRS
jgi:hypothetical protein